MKLNFFKMNKTKIFCDIADFKTIKAYNKKKKLLMVSLPIQV